MDPAVVKKITASLRLYAISYVILIFILLWASFAIPFFFIILILSSLHILWVVFLALSDFTLVTLGAILSYLLGFVAFYKIPPVESQFRALGLGARILKFTYLVLTVLYLSILVATWSRGYISFIIWQDLVAPSLLVLSLLGSSVLLLTYMCGLILFTVGLYRIGDELGDRLIRAGSVLLLPLGVIGAALAYIGLKRATFARLASGEQEAVPEDGTLPYEEREE